MSADGKGKGKPDGRGETAGRRSGRNTTYSVEAYKEDDGLGPIQPRDLIDPEMTGGAAMVEDMDGFHQPTAMFDKGKFLGELAELEGTPDTRAVVEAEPAPPKGCRLIIVAGPDLGMEWAYKVPEIVMGRDEDCELVMSDIAVSRRHAKIALEGGKFFLYDLGSGNGTFLNGVKIDKEELVPGDEIVVGERTLRFVELNEAPATAAAHPVPKRLPAEPSVGSVPPLPGEGNFEQLGKKSQVDVGVVPKDEPVLPTKPSQRAKVDPRPKPGSALQGALRGVMVLVVLGLLGGAGFFVYQRYYAGETPAQRAVRAKREFLQAVELVKQKRFGDAAFLLDRVLVIRPEHDKAQAYREHCKKELGVYQALSAARKLAAGGRLNEAIAAMGQIPEGSAYKEEAEADAQAYLEKIALGLVEDARQRYLAGDLDTATELLERALERAPQLKEAKELLAQVEAAKKERDKPVARPKARFEIPSQLLRAVALYKNGQIGPAVDACEAAGGPEAKEFAARMERMKTLLDEAGNAHQQKAAGELLRIAPAALDLDAQVAGGEGKVRDRIQKYYADGLYLKGVEAFQGGDDVKAYRLFSEALRANSAHKLARTGLAEISGKAQKIYFEGYVLKDSNPAEARKTFRRLTQITPPEDPYHQLAAKWLAQNGG